MGSVNSQPFRMEESDIKGLFTIYPHIFEDDRGVYRKYYEKQVYSRVGIIGNFTECSEIVSKKGALRGLHYQDGENSQAKLLHVVKGCIYDVAVDLRYESESFGRFHAEIMDASEDKLLYIPEGFAHGFLSLKEETIFSYQSTGQYEPRFSGGIFWKDTTLSIPWPIEEYDIQDVIITDKDKNWPTLREYAEAKRQVDRI